MERENAWKKCDEARIKEVFDFCEGYRRYISECKTERECAARIEEANRAVERIMSDGKKQFAELALLYQAEYRKWQQLHKAVKTLENPETQK